MFNEEIGQALGKLAGADAGASIQDQFRPGLLGFLLAHRQPGLGDQFVRALEPFVEGRFRRFGTRLFVRFFVHFVTLQEH